MAFSSGKPGRRRLSRWILRAALSLPVLLLIGVGVRTFGLEGVQSELDHQSSVRQLVLGIAARIERFAAGDPWPHERSAGSIAAPLQERPDRQPDDDQLLVLHTQFERAIAQGDDSVHSWLRKQAAGEHSERLRDWLDLRRAALQLQQDNSRHQEARDTWQRIAAKDHRFRDERGLRMTLLARALLLFDDPHPKQAAELAAELIDDQFGERDIATRTLRDRVLATHQACAADPLDHVDLLASLRRHYDSLSWRELRRDLDQQPFPESRLAVVRSGPGWLVAGRAVATPSGEPATEVRGITLHDAQHHLFPETLLQLAKELGVRIDLADAAGAQLLGSSNTEPSQTQALYRAELPGGIGSVAATKISSSAFAQRRAERRTGWLWAISIALAAAIGAAWFSLRALRKQEQLTEQRAGFVAAVSHELKTPLTATRLLGELLERGDLDDAKVREFGGRIARESERLDQLVRNVLDLSRVERIGLQPGAASVVDANDILDEARSRHLETAGFEESPAIVVRERAGDDDLSIAVDREALLGALANLLENACRHAAQSPQIELAASSCGSRSRIRLEVGDRGPGVRPDERHRIFGEFVRGGNEDTRRTRGTGIGLALVARIASAHGGRAFCEPQDPGPGSVFVIELPIATAATPDQKRDA